MKIDLLTPILDQGIRHTNFFEGRLLTGEDLRNQREANREHDRRLGRAIGPGIIEGLEVELLHDGSDGESPTVRVTKGLAINREGDIIGLPHNDITLALTEPREPLKWQKADFYVCAGPPGVQHLPSGAAVYVLVMSPVAGYKERAPKSGLGDNGIAKGCGSKYIQEGVQFRLVELTKSLLTTLEGVSGDTVTLLDEDLLNENKPVTKGDVPRLSKLRNVLAHLCLGSEQFSKYAADPFKNNASNLGILEYGAIAKLRELEHLNDCDVPLALFYWTLEGIAFHDLWSVRRRIYSDATAKDWPFLTGGPRDAVLEAIVLQFQEHLQSLISNDAVVPSTVFVEDYFHVLSPVGILPLISAARPRAFSKQRIFRSYMIGAPKQISPSQLGSLFKDGMRFNPIKLDRSNSVQLYEIREKDLPQNYKKSFEPYLIFVDALVPYISSEPRFDGVCAALEGAERAYHSLIEKQVFLVNETDPQSTPSRTLIVGAIVHVSIIAASWSAMACSRMSEVEEALHAMRNLYEAQGELVSVLNGPLPGLEDRSKLQAFAGELSILLDGSVGIGQQALKDALNNESLSEIVAAQNRINQLVLTWTDATVVGNIQVVRHGSTRGLTLVKEDPMPFNYIFRVTNMTNRTLDIQFSAGFLHPKQNWSESVSVLDIEGSEISVIRLEPYDETKTDNSKAELDVQASVITPDAELNDTGTLRLWAYVPPPVGLAGKDDVDLTIGTEEQPEEGTWISVPPPVFSHPPNNASAGVPVGMSFGDIVYHAEEEPTMREFTLALNVLSTATADRYFIEFPTDPFELQSDVPLASPINTQVIPLTDPSAVGTTLRFEAVVRSVDGEVEKIVGPYEIITVS